VTARAEPLAAATYLRRNPRRVLPAVVIQALVTALILAVVTPLTGFEATIEANLAPLSVYTGLTPLRKNAFDDELLRIVEANPALERHLEAKAVWMRMPAIVGEDASMLVALRPDDQGEFLRRVGDRLGEGAFPSPGTDGAAIHRDVARARGLSIGSRFGRLVDAEDLTPGSFTVTGIVDGPARVGVVDLAYASRPTFILAQIPPFRIVYAKPGRKVESDEYLNDAKDADGSAAFRVWDEAFWRRRTEKLLSNLPVILNAIVGAITVIITLVVILLNLIAFQARSDEFGLLLAVGVSRARLVRKVVVESFLIAVFAWALGLSLGYAFVLTYDRLFLEPKAILIRLFDVYPLALASVLPFVAAAVSAAVLARRLRRLDPVAIIQRRNA
jgi:hypothetical protein